MSLEFYKAFVMLLLTLPLYSGRKTKTTPWPERIVGGKDIPPGHHVPYQVSLQYFVNTSAPNEKGAYKHYCGGSIISSYHILTAAHCCSGFDPKLMSIWAGDRDLRSQHALRFAVANYTIHPNYEELVTSDIAIIKLCRPMYLDNVRMGAIDVSSKQHTPGGVTVMLTGWGLRLPYHFQVPFPLLQEQVNAVTLPNILQVSTFLTVSDEVCKQVIDQLTKTELCVTGDLFKGACPGDSGGPLVEMSAQGLRQVGIVSYGLFICGLFSSLVPDVYTRVSEFSDWIYNTMHYEL
ncbi:chymotrypsin-2-like [Stomoxys calcitrans]|uniref:Peptidase S1 domain-containing protein n=1 Tax=Stomoxys calcitrans TaxID=35570 RepID=A0A1I8Q9Y9_STOCA|nr:chymotrypsin-2-like [Stomoxys calcitrans]